MNLSSIAQSLPAARDPITLGKALAAARKACGLTQQELSARTGIAYSTLTKIERGAIKQPNVFAVFQITQATGVSLEDFLKDQVSQKTTLRRAPRRQTRASSATSVKFVYFDLHGVLTTSFSNTLHLVAAQLKTSHSKVRQLLSFYDTSLCKGEMSIEDLNNVCKKMFNAPSFDYNKCRDAALRSLKRGHKAVQMVAKHLPVGLLTNTFPGACSSYAGSKPALWQISSYCR